MAFLTVLNYSAGRQSHRLALGYLRGEIPIPERFIVVSADPGAEHIDTVRVRDKTLQRFNDMGIPAMVAPGPRMLEELIRKQSDEYDGSHLDQSAYWTYPSGRLPQHCTRHYKIRPMNRLIKAYIRRIGVKDKYVDLPSGFCTRQIALAADEQIRVDKVRQKWGSCPEDAWQAPEFPLVDMGEDRELIEAWYRQTGEEMPPPSVCNHCWANSVATFKQIHDTDGDGWADAVKFDEASRDLTKFGVRYDAYCSRTRMPLQELAAARFELDGLSSEALSCDSGHCFI